jgi:hypothetical protein
VPVAELERQVDEEYAQVVELEFDDQSLDSGVEVMKPLALDAGCGEECVRLLVDDGHQRIERISAVLALVGGVVAERLGDHLGLVDVPGADRAGVYLDEAHDVRIEALDEAGDALEDPRVAAQVTCARNRQVEGGAGARGIADVVEHEAHWSPILMAARRIREPEW